MSKYLLNVTKDDCKSPISEKSARKVALRANRMSNVQETATSADPLVLGVADAPGRIVAARCISRATAGSGESMVVDIDINGATALSSTMTIDDTVTAGVWTEGTVLATAAARFVAGDKISADLDYTSGTATPLVDTKVVVDVEYDY
jgi:hypothetical protein